MFCERPCLQHKPEYNWSINTSSLWTWVSTHTLYTMHPPQNHLFLHICVCTCWAHTCVCMSLWRPEVGVRCPPWLFSTLYFEAGSHCSQSLLFRLVWLARLAIGPWPFSPVSWDCKWSVHSATSWVWEIPVSVLVWQVFVSHCSWATVLASFTFYIFHFFVLWVWGE